MKTDLEKVNACRVKLAIHAEAADIKDACSGVKQAFQKEAKVPGFRPGKAPWPMIEKMYGDSYKKELDQRVLQVCYSKALKSIEPALDVCDVVDVKDLDVTPGQGMTCTVLIDLNPEVKAPDLKKMNVKAAEAAVADEAVEERITHLRGMVAGYENASDDDTVTENDLLAIAFTSDVPPEEVDEDARHWVKDDEYWVQLREDAFIPELREALVGKKKNVEIKHKVKYPADFHVKALAGKTVNYLITIKHFRKQKPATDEVLIQRMGVADMTELQAKIRENLMQTAEAAEESRITNEIVDYLIGAVSFDLPETALGTAVRDEVQRMLGNLRDVSEDELKQHEKEIIDAAKKAAERRVRLRYLAQAVAKAEEIKLSKEEIDAALTKTAQAVKLSVPETLRRLQDNDRLDEFLTDELVAKVLKILRDRCAK